MQTSHQSTYQTIVKAAPATVWEALTKAEIVKEYFFGSDQKTDWKVGSPILWTGEYEGQSYTDKGTVLEYVAGKRLQFSYLSNWTGLEDKPENYLMVTYEIKPVEGGTELTITQTNYDEEKARHSEENWALVINGLKKIVE